MNVPDQYRNKHSEWIDLITFNQLYRYINYHKVNLKANIITTYVLYNPLTFEFYIGSSDNTLYRVNKHRNALITRTHFNPLLQESFEKSLHIQVMFFITDTRENAYKIEQDLILANIDNKQMLNISIDVNAPRRGLLHSDESKQKMREKLLNSEHYPIVLKNLAEGRKKLQSPEAKERLLNRLKGNKYGVGQYVSEEKRERIRRINLGKHLSEETKEKLRQNRLDAYKNGFINARAVPIMVNGIRYISSNDAAKKLNIRSSLVWHRVNSILPKYKDWCYV